MRPRRVLAWLGTAVVLTVLCAGVPRFAPSAGEDPLPDRVGLGETARIAGGTVTIVEVLAAPRWTDGSQTWSLQGRGYFVEVRARVRPQRRADLLQGVVRSAGRRYLQSGRVGVVNDRAAPGFSSPQTLTFEVPTDVLTDGSVWVTFVDGSAARIALTPQTVRRIPVLERKL